MNFSRRRGSVSSRAVMIRFEGWMGLATSFALSDFLILIPSTVTSPCVMSTPMILPFFPRNFPRATSTSSPFRTGTARGTFQSRFFRRAGSTWAASILCFTCQGASAACFRCFRGCVLTMSGTSHNHARRRRDPGPPLGRLPRHGAFDVGPLRLPLGRREDARVVLEPHPGPVRAPERAALPDDDGVHHLLPHLGAPLLHGHDQEVPDSRGRAPAAHALVPFDRDDLDDLRARVVDALKAGAGGQAAGLAARQALHALTPRLWITTKETVLLSGRHSISVTRWPGARVRHGGACASIHRLRVSYRSNFWMYREYSRSTTTVRCIHVVTMTPSRAWPRTLSLPWNRQCWSV